MHEKSFTTSPEPVDLAVWLRRAVSAANYAVFHEAALRVGRQALPSGSAEDQQRLSRSVGHGALRDVCQWMIGKGTGKAHAQPIVAVLQQDARIVGITRITLRLQDERHRADDDHLTRFGKAGVLSLVNDRSSFLTSSRT